MPAHEARAQTHLARVRCAEMGLTWVLFNLTGTLVDPAVLAQPLGDSGGDEELVLAALDDTVAMAMADALTGETTPLTTLMEAALRRRLRLAGADEERAADALELTGTMPAYLEVPGALESLRSHGLRLGVLAQSSVPATDAVLRFAGLRDRFELVLSAQDAGAYRPDPRPYRMAVERTGASTAETCFVSTYWWDVAGAKRSGLHTAWVARRERSLLDTVPAPDYRGRDLAEVADAIVDGLAD
jgi:2-haloacid dehalogenase